MCTSYLAVEVRLDRGTITSEVGRMVLAHVVLERLAVRLCWRLPFRFLGAGVEVVGEVFAVGMSDLLELWVRQCDFGYVP